MAFDPVIQRRIMGRFATGVTVIATRDASGQYGGMTANAVASLSLEPPLVLVAVDRRAQTHLVLTQTRCFVMNVLTADQEHLSRRFALPGPKDYSDIPLTTAETGAPVFTEALAWVDCRVTDILAGGDHDIFVGEIVAGDAREGQPLLYYTGKYRRLAE
jgi:flavin reductase (DIM6/NTAB) family NADH-FMN oxidoreductase RutF